MVKYVLKRFGLALVTAFIILSLTFILVYSLPVDRFIGQEPQQVAYYEQQVARGYCEVAKGKPNPEVFLKSCEKLGVKSDEAYVLEDSEIGIMAAYLANIKVICVPDMKYPEAQYASKRYKIVETLDDVIDILER